MFNKGQYILEIVCTPYLPGNQAKAIYITFIIHFSKIF